MFVAILGASDLFSSAQPLVREMASPGTDFDALAERFQTALVKLKLDGLRKH